MCFRSDKRGSRAWQLLEYRELEQWFRLQDLERKHREQPIHPCDETHRHEPVLPGHIRIDSYVHVHQWVHELRVGHPQLLLRRRRAAHVRHEKARRRTFLRCPNRSDQRNARTIHVLYHELGHHRAVGIRESHVQYSNNANLHWLDEFLVGSEFKCPIQYLRECWSLQPWHVWAYGCTDGYYDPDKVHGSLRTQWMEDSFLRHNRCWHSYGAWNDEPIWSCNSTTPFFLIRKPMPCKSMCSSMYFLCFSAFPAHYASR